MNGKKTKIPKYNRITEVEMRITQFYTAPLLDSLELKNKQQRNKNAHTNTH